jgi:ComF family protein
MNIRKIRNILSTFTRYTINVLFPHSGFAHTLENLSPTQFYEKAKRPLDPVLNNYIHSLFQYSDRLVSQAIWELKYKGNWQPAHIFAHIIYDKIIEILEDEVLFSNFAAPLLIPIPLSEVRHKERGWNQAEMLARELKKLDTQNIFELNTEILKKVRHTLPQTKLNKQARVKNLKDCFAVSNFSPDKNSLPLQNRNIILLDDVVTTGSTIAEATKTLKLAGARKVIAITVAQA